MKTIFQRDKDAAFIKNSLHLKQGADYSSGYSAPGKPGDKYLYINPYSIGDQSLIFGNIDFN
ncbi:hypothetical protein VA7868_03291 [Vibrio aerogenes CECT 7868]|uniref:Uncharacterized protein n=1 Tax=Vibrio aerogenes CECT 7868 TaxID=1216006 RepID=A0A1M5ZV22_9VIBR|nr:hypothetical protein VA7868_03291 [Vibrio aerogenes CECT 7868]